jgi:hypothetical protein
VIAWQMLEEMRAALDNPFLVLLGSLIVFSVSAWIGTRLHRQLQVGESDQENFSFVLGGTLTLLGLIVGFTFSMAVGRYDLRKSREEQEANAIGTAYVQADLLPATDAARVRGLLRDYADQRVLFYTLNDAPRLRRVGAETTRLQTEMWTVVASHASAQPTPVSALTVSGMNDVLNSQGYAQAASWNQIPTEAWALVIGIAIFCNGLIGLRAHGRSVTLLLILPLVLSVTLFLIADIDSPRIGVIHVVPRDLSAVAESVRGP